MEKSEYYRQRAFDLLSKLAYYSGDYSKETLSVLASDADLLITEFEQQKSISNDSITKCAECGNERHRLCNSCIEFENYKKQSIGNGNWISVNDRLPDENTRVYTYYKFSDEMHLYDCLNYPAEWKDYITHWSPIPMPPRQ